MLDKAGFEEDVAVKVLSLRSAQPGTVDLAMRELQLMCTVSQQLAGYVVELKGFMHEPGRQLVLVLELAEHSLRDYLQTLPGQCLSLAQWVRHPLSQYYASLRCNLRACRFRPKKWPVC